MPRRTRGSDKDGRRFSAGRSASRMRNAGVACHERGRVGAIERRVFLSSTPSCAEPDRADLRIQEGPQLDQVRSAPPLHPIPLVVAPAEPGRSGSPRPKVGFAMDSPLEGDGFEPSVPRKFFWLPRRSREFTFRNINRASLATGTDGPGPTVVRVSPGREHLGTPAQSFGSDTLGGNAGALA
jgi:hypothetical protein